MTNKHKCECHDIKELKVCLFCIDRYNQNFNKLVEFVKGGSMPNLSDLKITEMEYSEVGSNDHERGKNVKLEDIVLHAREWMGNFAWFCKFHKQLDRRC
jgi:hypothetical protein